MLKQLKPFTRYKWNTGMFAWILHRLSGLVLAFYLLMHLYVTNHLTKGEVSFDKMMGLVDNPLVKILEIGLLGVVLYHAVNGIRVVLLNYGLKTKIHRFLFWLLVGLGIIIFIFGAYPLLP